MTLYIDIVIILDFLCNMLFTIFINKTFKEKINIVNLIVVSLILALLIIPAIYNHIVLKIFKIIGGIIFGFLIMCSCEKEKVLIKIALFYALNFGFIGVLFTFRINTLYLFFIALAIIFVVFIFENHRKYFIYVNRSKYNIFIDNKKIIGFMDNGNLSSHLGYPVIFVNYKYQPKNYLATEIICIETVIGTKYLQGIIKKNFEILINEKRIKRDVVIVYTDITEDCILNPILII